jgi:thermitase
MTPSKKLPPAVITLAIVLIVSIAATSGAMVSSSATTEELIIGFTNNAGPALQQALRTEYDYTVLERNEALNCVLVQVSRDDSQHVITSLAEEDFVRYVEPNKRVHALLYTPNDPRYPDQWGPQSIKADWAWDHERGNKNVTIAIIDSGIDYTHEDLCTNYIAGGYDWVNNDSDPMDDYGHGTHCAGIAAATLNNEKGIAGIAQVNLLAEKMLDETGWGTEWDLAQAIVHAADSNVDIISLSVGGDDDVQAEEDACLYAWNHGCLLVASSGNDYSAVIKYPAAY